MNVCYTLDGGFMLKKIIDKRNYIILFIIFILIIWILFFNKKEIYLESFEYYGEVITYKVYDKVNHKKLTDEINKIYKKYENINFAGKLDEKDKSLLEYGKILYYKTDGYVDVTSGELLKKLKDGENYDFKSDIEKLNNNDIDDINFNFENIIGSYATNEVLYYFKQNDITKYIVSENGDVTTGNYYDDGKYSVSINNSDGSILDIAYLENKSMAIRFKLDEFKSYMVNPKTSKKQNKYKMVVVIANDNLTANMLANTLYLMDVDEGKKMIHDYNAEAMWVIDETIKTDGFDSYLKN